MRYITCLGLLILAGALPARGQVDRLVNPAGGPGTYQTITQAMLASNPGDRILVMPGQYGFFQFSRGVHLIGLGANPEDVVIERIAFHVSIPTPGYDALISNVTVDSSNPVDVLSIHGNELAPGTLTIDGCVLRKGVFLRGGQQGFYLLINNSKITPTLGAGFSSEACWLGGPGNHVDLRNTRITGWNADALGVQAGVGLRVAAGTRMRIDGCVITGGNGVAGQPVLAAGASGVVGVLAGSVELRIDGGSAVTGGAGVNASGGHGVAAFGTVEVGSAVVAGGAGSPSGLPYAFSGPTFTTLNPHLSITPNLSFADGPVKVSAGQQLTVQVGNGTLPSLLAIALSTDIPLGSQFVPIPLSSATIISGSSFSAWVPFVPGLVGPGPTFYVQGAVGDPVTGSIVLSNTAAVRVDFQ